jgi:hypothetical protein
MTTMGSGANGWAVRRLEDVPVVPDPEPGWPNWHPIRHVLGIESFGVNVFVARASGDLVVVDHDENAEQKGATGHEELYVVVRGEVEFTVEGETFDAPAVTFVACKPPVRRKAVAKAAGDTVVAIGGTLGSAFVGSEWERRWTEGLPTA